VVAETLKMSTEAQSEEHTFDTANAGASLTYPSQASALRKGGYVVMNKTRPCKVVELSVSKPGKHGHAKVNITAIDVFTSKKYDHVAPSHSTVEVPYVRKQEYLLLDIVGDGFLSLFNVEGGETKDDVKIPGGEVGEKLTKMFGEKKQVHVVVQAAMGEEAVIEAKEVKEV
jgi:translation initiation factor 5A